MIRPLRFFFFMSLFYALAIPLQAKTIVSPSSQEDLAFLGQLDKKYQKNSGIHIKLKKTVESGILGTSKTSEGEVWIGQGKMRLHIIKPEASKIVADGTSLWIESPAPSDFKGSQTQVLKLCLSSKQVKSQGLFQILTKGGVLKHFQVSGVQKSKEQITYFLQPNKTFLEFKRVNIVVNRQSSEIKTLKYWDQMDNQTLYSLIETQFNQNFKKTLFAYTPPKGSKWIPYCEK